MSQESNKQKPSSLVEMVEFFKITPRAKSRLDMALNDEVIKQLTWTTMRSLAFASRDPKTSAKDMTLSQKVMMYRRYDKLWESIADAVRLYGSSINDIKCEPEIGEDVAVFRARYLQSIISINK